MEQEVLVHGIKWIAFIVIVMALAAPVSGPAQTAVGPVGGRPPGLSSGLEGDVYLVTFVPGTPASERAAAVVQSGAALRQNFSNLDVVSVQVPDESALARLRAQGRVLSIVPNLPFTLALAPAPQGNGGGKIPRPPSDLSAVLNPSNQVLLFWTDQSRNDEDGFQIERCSGSCTDTGFSLIRTTGPNEETYLDLSASGPATYTYRVRAFNENGTSAYSDTSEVAVPDSGGGGGNGQVIPAGVQRIGARGLTVTGDGVGVAIVDTGLDFAHSDLRPAPESFSYFNESCQDPHSHGTHVGGIVAARDNDIDVVGVAPDATLYCVDVFMHDPLQGTIASDESIVAGLNWILSTVLDNPVDPPIRVANMSLGRARTAADGPAHPIGIALQALHAAGISVVAAAGNNSYVEVSSRVPASYPQVVAVASVNAVEGLNGSANYPNPCSETPIPADAASKFTTDGAFLGGVGVTISAPGALREDIGELFPGWCVVEQSSIGILSTRLGGGTIRYAGTSMAAPHVAGVIALMWEYELDRSAILPPEAARDRIRENADGVDVLPLDSPVIDLYTFDGEREGIVWAPGAVEADDPPPADQAPTVTISQPTGSTFAFGDEIVFEASASDPEDGSLSGLIEWTSSIDGDIGSGPSISTTSLSTGGHLIVASVVDSGGNTAIDTASISVGSAGGEAIVSVAPIEYSVRGKHLRVLLTVTDDGGPVADATVAATLVSGDSGAWDFAGSTDGLGQVLFQLNHAPANECYSTNVTAVTASEGEWDELAPSDPTVCIP